MLSTQTESRIVAIYMLLVRFQVYFTISPTGWPFCQESARHSQDFPYRLFNFCSSGFKLGSFALTAAGTRLLEELPWDLSGCICTTIYQQL